MTKKLYRLKMDEYNRERREKRRLRTEGTEESRTDFKDIPTHQALKDALRDIRSGHTTIIRLAALMDNLAMYEARRIYLDGSKAFRGKTNGIKIFLRQDGYLYSRYSSLMRYRKLGKLLRKTSGVDVEVNLLWGLEPTCPTDDGEPLFETEYAKLHSLYDSLKGMNFKEITLSLTRRLNT